MMKTNDGDYWISQYRFPYLLSSIDIYYNNYTKSEL